MYVYFFFKVKNVIIFFLFVIYNILLHYFLFTETEKKINKYIKKKKRINRHNVPAASAQSGQSTACTGVVTDLYAHFQSYTLACIAACTDAIRRTAGRPRFLLIICLHVCMALGDWALMESSGTDRNSVSRSE